MSLLVLTSKLVCSHSSAALADADAVPDQLSHTKTDALPDEQTHAISDVISNGISD